MRHNGLNIGEFSFCIAVVLFVFSVNASAQPWLKYDEQFTGIPQNQIQLQTQTMGTGHYRITFSQPQVQTEAFDYQQSKWTYVSIEGETRLWQEGKPALPAVTRSVRIADRGRATVKIISTKFHDLKVSTVCPQQPIPIEGKPELSDKQLIIEAGLYKTDSWFPTEIAGIGNYAILRDARIGLLSVYPVRYNPVQGVLRVYDSIELEITPNNQPGENELYSAHRPVPSFAPFYRDIIGGEELYDESIASNPGQILLIARNDATIINALQPWIDWKTQSGRKVQLVTLPTTVLTTPDVQAVITSAYNNSNPPLESVIIVGDGGTMGNFYVPTNYNYIDVGSGCDCYGDHEYYQLAGNDILADVNYGRFSVENLQDLRKVVSRTLVYEKNPSRTDTTWFTRGWGYAGYMGYYSTTSIRPAIRFCNTMMYQRGITDTLYDEHIGNVSSQLINTRVDQGINLWAHRSSSGADMHPSDVVDVQNIGHPYIAFHISCSQGHWYGAGNVGVNEAEIRLGIPSQPLGALTSMAPDDPTGVTYNNCLATGCYYGFGILGVRNPSSLYLAGKYFMWRNFDATVHIQALQNSYENNQMGDVTANIWTGVPHTITANPPAVLSIADDHLDLVFTGAQNDVRGALVTAWKSDSSGNMETCYPASTDSNGFVRLMLTNQTAGNMIVTVIGNRVGQNIVPYIDTIAIQSSPVQISAQTPSIIDDTTNGRNGNNDGTANPGETCDFNLHFTNTGNTLARNITVTCAPVDSALHVVQSNFPNIDSLARGDTTNVHGTVLVQLSSSIHNNEIFHLRLQLNIGSPAQVCTLYVPVTVHSIESNYISSAFYTSNGTATTFSPGTTVRMGLTLMNRGVATDSTNISLHSLSPFVSIIDSNSYFPTFPANQQVTTPSGQRFSLTAISDMMPGTPAQLMAVLHTRLMWDTVYFSVPVGTRRTTDPTGPDAYGYYAYENLDTSYEWFPVYNWREILPVNGGQGTRLALYDSMDNRDQSILVGLPFPVQYYGRVYDSITVCSNGWMAFGCQPIYNNMRNWHLPAGEGPRNIVAVNWFDFLFSQTNEGVFEYYDSTAHTYTLTWKARLAYNSLAEECQVVIYDEQYHVTPTHDADLLFQYKTFNNTAARVYDVDFCTIGIADSNYQRGLEYTYWNSYTPGSTPMANGANTNRAILFTTWSQNSDVSQTRNEIRISHRIIRSYPNPFNANSRIEYNLPESGRVTIAIFNIGGQEVKRLLTNSLQTSGTHVVNFDGSKLPTGIYFCRITTGSRVYTTKLTLLK